MYTSYFKPNHSFHYIYKIDDISDFVKTLDNP